MKNRADIDIRPLIHAIGVRPQLHYNDQFTFLSGYFVMVFRSFL